MTLRVERIGDRLGILLTQAQLDELCLREDSELEVATRSGRLELTPVVDGARPDEVTYVTVEEGMTAYKTTEPRWAAVYRELAK